MFKKHSTVWSAGRDVFLLLKGRAEAGGCCVLVWESGASQLSCERPHSLHCLLNEMVFIEIRAVNSWIPPPEQ